MRRLTILLVLYLGMQSVFPLRAAAAGAEALMTFGFLILAAYTVGEVATTLRAPKIVGYLVAGVLFGPAALGTFTKEAAQTLGPVGDLAIALIAFLAGAELRWGEVRDRGTLILKMMTAELLMSFAGIFAVIVLLHERLPVLAAASTAEVAAFAMIFAAVAIVHSPAVTMALLSETGARGVVARTTLGVVLVADVAVVLLFSAVLAVARAIVPPAAGGLVHPAAVLWEIGGAVLVGAALGGAVALYLRFVRHDLIIFAIVIAFLGAELARVTHVETLLTLLTAGFVTENASGGRGDALRHAMERSAAPIFVVFFALSGAKIAPADVVALSLLVVPVVLVRAGSIWAGMRLGARWARAEPEVARHAWMGLVSQAGVAIGLSAVVAEVYPARGAQLRALLLAVIAVNEMVGPLLFRRALARSGELPEVAHGIAPERAHGTTH